MRKLLSSHRSLYLFTLAALVVSITGATGTPFVGADSQVGGIISEDTTWTAENSPYEITETVQIPSGVTLTIEPGVIISKPSSGDMFVLMGTIRAHGTSQKPIVIDGGGNSKIIYTQPGYGYGDFQYCIIQNGYDFWDRWGHLDLRYSELVNLGTGGNWGHSAIKLDGPSGESNIEFNKFINTGGIYSYSDHYGTNIRYNLFQGLLSPLAHMGGGAPSSPPKEMIVKYNSFVNTEGLALYLESGFIGWSPSIDATQNYWDTLDTNIIDQMIWDRNDDITIDNYISYLPILTEPHPDTPKVSPPITPCNPSPANHASGVSVDADLSWTGGAPDAGDTVTYDVYFGTSASPPLVSNDQSGTTYDPGTLAYNTKYYWKIIATDNHGASATGPLWDLTTETAPTPTNSPPNIPSNPTPSDCATGILIKDADLSWTSGDSDSEDTVTYDVYFGKNSTPPLRETIGPYPAMQLPITYDPGTLVNDVTYFWKIVARDNHGTEAESPVWEFTTAEEIVEYYLTVSSTAGGSVTEPDEGTFTYDEGAVVDLRVAVEESSRFLNWTGDVDTIANVEAAATNITMHGDYSITANFEEIPLPPMNWPLIGGIIAGVVAVGLVIVFVRKRGRGPEYT